VCLEGRSFGVLSLGLLAAGAACSRLHCQLVQEGDRQGHLEVHRGLHTAAVVVVGHLDKELDRVGVPKQMTS